MKNQEAKKLVACVFNAISSANSVDDVKKIFTDHTVLKSKEINKRIYPELTVSISPDDIEDLKKSSKILEDNTINVDTLSPLEKVLYAVMWKNRDAKKEQHVIRGILSTRQPESETTEDDALVFYQFGRHLADPNEPIVDQHTLRASKFYSVLKTADEESFSKIRCCEKFTSTDLAYFKHYIDNVPVNSLEFKKEIDNVLYALGKAIKMKRDRKSLGSS